MGRIKLKKKIPMQQDLMIYVLAGLLNEDEFLYYDDNEKTWVEIKDAVSRVTNGEIRVPGNAMSFERDYFLRNKDKKVLITVIDKKEPDEPFELYLYIDKYGYITHIELEE